MSLETGIEKNIGCRTIKFEKVRGFVTPHAELDNVTLWIGGKSLLGVISNDSKERFADGTEVTTSKVNDYFVDANGDFFAKTQNTTYKLNLP